MLVNHAGNHAGLRIPPPRQNVLEVALATELEDAKVKACYDLIAYIESLSANFVRNYDLGDWVMTLSQTMPEMLTKATLLVALMLCLRDDRFYFSITPRKYRGLILWAIHLPRSFAELAGNVLADLAL